MMVSNSRNETHFGLRSGNAAGLWLINQDKDVPRKRRCNRSGGVGDKHKMPLW